MGNTAQEHGHHRYLLVDHFSGVIWVKYFNAPGENPADLTRFLHSAWTLEGRGDLPFHGVPELLLADQGAAFKATTTKNLLRLLDVKLELHGAGNARASGAVEVAHNIWESLFESRLRFSPARTLEELNARAEAFAFELNCSPEHLHSRHGKTRVHCWLGIDRAALRVPPDWRRFVRLAHANPITREVDENGHISVDNRPLAVSGNVYAGEKVTVLEYPYAENRWRVLSCRGEELVVTVLRRNAGGYLVGARHHEIGSEGGAGHPLNLAQKLRRESEENPIWLAEPFTAAESSPTFITPEGAPAIADEALPAAPVVDALQVRLRAQARLVAVGVAELPAEVAALIDERVADGVPSDQVEPLLDDVLSELESSSLNHWFGGSRTA